MSQAVSHSEPECVRVSQRERQSECQETAIVRKSENPKINSNFLAVLSQNVKGRVPKIKMEI